MVKFEKVTEQFADFTRSLLGRRLACLLVNTTAFIGLTLMTFISRRLVYDEPAHLECVGSLSKLGFSIAFLRNSSVAPGPLFCIIHYFLQPLTHLQLPFLRLVNIFLLGLLIFALVFLFRIKKTKNNEILSAFSILGAPMTMVISGMTLTEIPAMVFFYSGLLLLLLSIQSEDYSNFFRFVCALSGGLAIALSVYGRQTFFAALLALPLLAIYKWKFKNLILICLCAALVPSLVLFSIWGGSAPPLVSHISNGFSVTNLFLSFSYAGVVMMIFSPAWFSLGGSLNLKVFFLILIGNCFTGFFDFKPGLSMAYKIFPESLIWIYWRMASSAFIACGILFLVSIVKNIKENLSDGMFVFFCVTLCLILGTSGKITAQYSSRYLATAIPLLVLVGDNYSSESYWKALRMGLGSIIGILILATYLKLL